MRIRNLGRLVLFAVAGYGALHLASVVVDAGRAWPERPRSSSPALTARQQPLVSALTRLLHEDGVREADRWASAIVRCSPTEDLGYLALVTAQIRRESHFLAPDLEWLYRRVVPDLVHSLGVDDPIRTIGPMQVQRWRLRDHFEQALGRTLDRRDVADLAFDIEHGVAACVAVLDRIVVDYVPDRHLTGWIHQRGPQGLREDVAVLANAFPTPPPERAREALRQKLLSDLTSEPLALDGVRGGNTRDLLRRHPDYADDRALRTAWQARFDAELPDGIAPRIAHAERLAFVLADFHSGNGSCRTAALQALTNELCGSDLAVDGKWGPVTRAAMPRLLVAAEPDAARRAEFEELLAKAHKPRWVADRLLAMARRQYRAATGTPAPDALVPDFWFDNATTRIKGLGRISVAGYVAGSVAVYEDYLRRLCTYTGREPQPAQGR